MIKHLKNRAALVALAVCAVLGLGAAAAAALVPNSGGQLTGTVYVCVSTANEGRQYVELQHPAPGNCAAGYLQYTVNQPAAAATVTETAPAGLVNSENFEATSSGQVVTVTLPAGTSITGTPAAKDLSATVASPDTVTVTSVDAAAGKVTLAYSSADPADDIIQVTYDYS